MAFSPQFLDEIRNRVSLAELIGRRTKLVRKGREFSGLCPFHNEKTPSFTVNEEKGFYHCFGCGAHGDQVEFLKQSEGVSFREAIERLVDLAGMEMPVERPEERQRQQQAATLHDVMETATQWFEGQLASNSGAHARTYVEKRELTAEAIRQFRIGFASESRTALKEALTARGISEELMLEAGLIIKPDDGRPSYDRFRDRLIFPITDRQGRVIAFGGRALGDAPAKYLNSPDTPLFHKGRVLYNMAAARRHSYDAGSVIVAEGYMDVIALAQAGFENAVAPLGTAITEEQLQMLWKMAAEPVMCLDGDSAGWRAALRAAERALPLLKPGYSLRFALLPEGVDPDDLAKNGGAAAIRNLIEAALPLSELLWRKELEGRQVKTPEQKAAFEKALSQTTADIQDPTVKGYYQQYFKNRLWEWNRENGRSSKSGGYRPESKGRFDRFANQNRKTSQNREKRVTAVPDENWGRGEKLLVLAVLNHPEILDNHFDTFARLRMKSVNLDRVHAAIIEIATSESDLDYSRMKHQLSSRGLSEVVARLEQTADGSLDWFISSTAALEDATKGWLHLLARHKRDELVAEVKTAEMIFGEEATRENLDRLRHAKQSLQNAEGNEVDLDGFGVASGRNTGF